jgi:tRNA 2-thiouridine synthesizing protein E
MSTVVNNDPRLQFDEDGFLLDTQAWTPQLALEIADADGLLTLSPEHWKIIDYLREHYLNFGTLPVMNHVCWVNNLGRHCVHELFHNPREAWRIAGLPNPGEEAKARM